MCIRDRIIIKRDNANDDLHVGKEVALKIFHRDEIAGGQSRYQIADVYKRQYVNKVEAELKEAAATLRVPPFDVSERVAADQKALKEMRTKAKRAKSMIGDDMFSALLSQEMCIRDSPLAYGRRGLHQLR